MAKHFSFLSEVPLRTEPIRSKSRKIRTFELLYIPDNSKDVEGIDFHVESWEELQQRLNLYVRGAGVSTTLDLVWIDGLIKCKANWSIQEIQTPPEFKRRWSL